MKVADLKNQWTVSIVRGHGAGYRARVVPMPDGTWTVDGVWDGFYFLAQGYETAEEAMALDPRTLEETPRRSPIRKWWCK